MRKAIVTGLTIALLSALSATAEAAPSFNPGVQSMGSAAAIETVSGGCGPGGFRAANGLCYRRRPPPPPHYYGRRCPPGMHLTPYGCRRNF